MFKWVVSICLSCYEVPFTFENAKDAEIFAQSVVKTMGPYDTDKDGKPRMARIYIKAVINNDEEED